MGIPQSRNPGKKENIRVLMLGLDGVGKTTLFYKLVNSQTRAKAVPTKFFNMQTVRYDGAELKLWDISGRKETRQIWNYFFAGAQGIIFVIDSTDRKRIDEAKEELHKIMLDRELIGAPILIYANKQDLPNAMSINYIEESLGLTRIGGRKLFIQSTSTGSGILQGLKWLVSNLKS